MKPHLTSLLCALSLLCGSIQAVSQTLLSGPPKERKGVCASPRPNLLILFTDDMGYADIGKWHLSGNSSAHSGNDIGGFLFKPPHERGFDEFVGITGGMHSFWKGTGLAENTLTVFANDNGGGGNNAREHTRNTAINLPHRGHKFDAWEGGVRVPRSSRPPGGADAS